MRCEETETAVHSNEVKLTTWYKVAPIAHSARRKIPCDRHPVFTAVASQPATSTADVIVPLSITAAAIRC